MEENVKSKLLGLESGGLVVLTVIIEGMEMKYQGFCTLFREEEDWAENDYVCLANAVDIIQDVKSIKPHFFNISSIVNVEIITPPVDTKSENEVKEIEVILPTIVINERPQLEELVETLEGVEVVGFSLEGQNIGRFGTVKWINFLVKNTIVALQIQPLSMDMGGENNLWSKLESTIFNNSRLVKVVHDCRAAADYLLHQHSITLLNVFDTMIAVYYLEGAKNGPCFDAFKSLSKGLQLYLPDKIHPQELKVLTEYEMNGPNFSGWLIEPLPSPDLLKIGAIKIKYLIHLRKILLCKLMEGYRNTVNGRIDYVVSNCK